MRKSRESKLVVAVGCVFVFGLGSVRAAEFQLKTRCQADGALVTLGDVADIYAVDQQQADRLAAIELFPAPVASRQRFVRLREIQELLMSRGVNLVEHRFSGSSQVAVLGGNRPAESEPAPRPLSSFAAQQSERRLGRSLVQYLQQAASANHGWTPQFTLTSDQARLLCDGTADISISGGAAPWTGSQRFEVTADTAGGRIRFSLDVQVSLPPATVTSVRSLSRGAVICAADVELCRGTSSDGAFAGFYSLDEVIGKQTTRAIPEGQAFRQEWVRQPLLVRRGEVVTLTALSAGIRVRTMARARDDGSLGELISVESLTDRKSFFARVAAVREVEVYGRAIRADGGGVSRVVRR